MDAERCRALVAAARVACLATLEPDGRPHLVPVVYAMDRASLYFAVDEKPKRHRRLRRLRNIEQDERVSLLVQGYDEDWTALWWVRVDGRARIAVGAPEQERALHLLAVKYPQYAERTPLGPFVAVDVERWTGWSASDP